MSKVLITGAAGFIGAALSETLVERGFDVVGIDNLNDYYNPQLKLDRLAKLGVKDISFYPDASIRAAETSHAFRFFRMDIMDAEALNNLFAKERFDYVVNLAAQAGARYSAENPQAFITSNISGFVNILENCRIHKVKHLLYASSSSVYGINSETPNSESHRVDSQVSVYGATKRCDELLAHVYAYQYHLPVSAVRLFTVYGPWGRPDMSPYLFTEAILKDTPISLYNGGNMKRDFTYIDDIVKGISLLLPHIPTHKEKVSAPDTQHAERIPYRIVNIGNSSPVMLNEYVEEIEKAVGKRAIINTLPMQPGDVPETFCDSTLLENITGFRPSTPLSEGISKTVKWYKEYYNKH